MTRQDIPGGVRLNTIAGWNQTEADWERFLAASPNGCFVMEDGDKIVGTAATFPFENKFAWISMVLVDPANRNQGIGTSLLRRAIECLDGTRMPTQKLDATPAGKSLYEKLGFVTECEIDRWVLKRTISDKSGRQAIATTPERLSEVFEFDREAFGADRSALLRSLGERAPDLTLVDRDSNRLIGYMFGRRGLFADHLGPWMARDAETARSQLAEFLERSSRDTIVVDALRANPITANLLRENGFSPARLLTRMYRGPNSFPGNPAFLCAILGPEFG